LVPLRRSIFAAAIVCALALAPAAHADQPTYQAATKAWENGDLDEAAKGYDQAINEGGLAPKEVLTAYARLGTYKAALGKQDEALSAFRLAASLDPDFQLPNESGPKAAALYKKAHKEAEGLGGKLEIKAEVPTEAQAAHTFSVIAHLPDAFAPLVDRVAIDVKDGLTGQGWNSSAPAEATVQFEVPSRAVPSGATLVVRVDALDVHGNRYASSETRVKVSGSRATFASMDEPEPEPTPKEEPPKKGFWQSPWPYAIGGGIVAASLVTFFATRPTDDVMVTAPRWK
jgi:hypothetical protein